MPNFSFEATGLGSVPFKNPKESCRAIFESFKEIPFWPQLPKRSFLENMYLQFSEKLPGLVLDESAKTVHIDTSRVSSDIEEVYSKYLDSELEYFKISRPYAEGFYAFLEALGGVGPGIKYLKGHITGPISYSLFLTDQNKRSAIYDADLFEVITKVLSMKARWQVRKLKKIFPRVMIFIDEPYLVSIGSSFVNIDHGAAFGRLDEVIAAIRQEGSLVGLHCCGNTDWGELLKRDIDILSFDAYNFAKEFSVYARDVANFLSSGRTIAWGVVPSSGGIDVSAPGMLSEKLRAAMKLIAENGAGNCRRISSIITPSCGVGSLTEDQARSVMDNTRRLSEEFQKMRDAF